MNFSDLHIHILSGVDDGTGYFGDNIKGSEEAFTRLSAYVSEKYPQMKLYLGNELRYSKDCVSWL